LMKRIDRQAQLRVTDRRGEIVLALGRVRESGERVAVLGPQRVGLGGLPVVERGAVAEREALQEIAPIELRRLREPALTDRVTELEHVDPQILAVEVDRLALRLEPPIPERSTQHRERPTQRAAGLLLV